MKQAVTLPVDEIQLYRLKVLAYGDRQGAIINKRDEVISFDDTMRMKLIATDILNENGYYENLRRVYTRDKKNISKYAYNQCCNLYDQVGFGLTAFSSYRDRFSLNTQHFDEYYSLIDSGKLPVNRGYIRSPEQQLRWSVILPLKNFEVRKKRFAEINDIELGEVFNKKMSQLKENGLIEETDASVKLTKLGALVADEVVQQFCTDEFIPFPKERYADGELNPYSDNTTADAFGLTKEKIVRLLRSAGDEQAALFQKATSIRNHITGNSLKIRGVIEVSNACRENCNYCAMRRDNKTINRYTLTTEEIMKQADEIVLLGIKIIFLQSGESEAALKNIKKAIPKIKEKHKDVEVLLCIGKFNDSDYAELKQLGADSFILKFEVSNDDYFNKISGGADFNERIEHVQK